MFNSVDTEKTIDKIQHLFGKEKRKKNLRKLGIDGNFLI